MTNEMNNAIQKTDESTFTESTPDTIRNRQDTHQLNDFVIASIGRLDEATISIRPRGRGEIFSTTGDKITISCLIERTLDSLGNFQHEKFYPIKQDLIPEISDQIRIVTFHGCQSLEGGHFIYPCKNNAGAFKNSWNSSLEQALQTPSGTYFSLSVNAKLQTYEVELYEGQVPSKSPLFSNFESSLTEILSESIITSANHPMVQALLNK